MWAVGIRSYGVGTSELTHHEGARCEADNPHIGSTNEEGACLLKRPAEVYLLFPACCGLGDIAPDWREALQVL